MPRRATIRYPGYDYSHEGAYVVMLCVRDRIPWFRIEALRVIAERCWRATPEHHPYAELDAWVVMPELIHGIILLHDLPIEEGSPASTLGPKTMRHPEMQQSIVSPQRRSLAVVIRSFKGGMTMEARRAGYPGFAWQRGYYDRIVRDQRELMAVRTYFENNPRAAGEGFNESLA